MLVLSNTKSLSYSDHWSNYLPPLSRNSAELNWRGARDGHKGFCMYTHYSHNTTVIYSAFIIFLDICFFRLTSPANQKQFLCCSDSCNRKAPNALSQMCFFFLVW